MRPRWLATSLILLCLAAGSVNLLVGMYGARPWIRPVAAFSGVCPEKGYLQTCPRPLSPDERKIGISDSLQREVLAAVLEDPSCGEDKTCMLMPLTIGPQHFQYYRVKYWPDSKLLFAGPGAHMWGHAYKFWELLNRAITYLQYPRTAVISVGSYGSKPWLRSAAGFGSLRRFHPIPAVVVWDPVFHVRLGQVRIPRAKSLER